MLATLILAGVGIAFKLDLSHLKIEPFGGEAEETEEGLWIDVRTYGAKVDNSTDDSAAIQAAINAAEAAGGGTVLIPGRARHSSTINLKSRVSLIGLGRDISQLTYTGNTKAISCAGTAGSLLRYVELGNLHIHALNPVNNNTILLYITATRDSYFHDLLLEDTNDLGIGLKVEGDYAGRKGKDVLYCDFERIRSVDHDYGVYIDGDVSDVVATVNNNTFKDISSQKNATDGWYITWAANNSFININGEANTGRGLHIDGHCIRQNFFGGHFESNAIKDIDTVDWDLKGGTVSPPVFYGTRFGTIARGSDFLNYSYMMRGNEDNGIFKIEEGWGSGNITWVDKYYEATVQTTKDAPVKTLKGFTLSANETYLIEASVVAQRADHNGRAAYVVHACVLRKTGGALLQGVNVVTTIESDETWNCTIDVTGNYARILVTGAAATIDWRGKIRVTKVTSGSGFGS